MDEREQVARELMDIYTPGGFAVPVVELAWPLRMADWHLARVREARAKAFEEFRAELKASLEAYQADPIAMRDIPREARELTVTLIGHVGEALEALAAREREGGK